MLTKAGTADNNSDREDGGGRTNWHKRHLHISRLL